MRSGRARLAGPCLAAVIAAGPWALQAQTVQTGVTVSAGASAETNPYFLANTDGVYPAVTGEVRPRLSARTQTSSFDLDGFFQFRQFLREYGLEDNYGASANMRTRVSERLTLRANTGFSSTRGGFNPIGRPALSPLVPPILTPGAGSINDPLQVAPPGTVIGDRIGLITDPTVLGQLGRVNNFRGLAGLDAQLSPRSTLSADINASATRVGGPGLLDINSVSAEARYSRTLNESTSIGLIGSYGISDFLGTQVGDAQVASALVSLDRSFGPRWSASLAAGLSHTRVEQGPGFDDRTFVAFNARARICREGDLSRFCFTGSRSPAPAAFGGVFITTALGADYTRRISERERISLAGSYTNTGGGRTALGVQPSFELANASARYDNQIAQRLSLFVTGSFGKIWDNLTSRRANVGAAAGLQYRFGALQ
jgi:hypothetical protein